MFEATLQSLQGELAAPPKTLELNCLAHLYYHHASYISWLRHCIKLITHGCEINFSIENALEI